MRNLCLKFSLVTPLLLFFTANFNHSDAQGVEDISELKINLYVNYMYLNDVFDTISTISGVPITYSDSCFNDQRYTHYFENTPLNRALDLISKESKKNYSWAFFTGSGVFIQAREEMKSNYEEIEALRNYEGPAEKWNFTINGKILDETNGEPLPFVNVGIQGTTLGTSSNTSGFFTLYNVPSDTSTIVFKYLGYSTLTYKLNPSLIIKNMSIELAPSTVELEQVEIVAERDKDILFSTEDISMVKLAPRQIAKLPNVGEQDPFRALQLMPGVSASNESSSGLYVRGGTPDQNLIVYDGFTVYHVDHLYGFYSAFNSNAIKDIQLYKGGFDAKFGGRLSSVTEITGKDGNSKKFNLGASLSLLSMNAFLEAPVGKVTTMFAFRRSWKGPLYNTIFDKYNEEEEEQNIRPGRENNVTNTVSSYFYDVNAKVTYHFNEKDKLSVSFFNGTDKLDNSLDFSSSGFGNNTSMSNNENNDITKYGNLGSSILWSKSWNSKLFSNILLSYSNYYSMRDKTRTMTRIVDDVETTFSGGLYEDNDLYDYSFKTDFEYRHNKNYILEFGTFSTLYDISYLYTDNDTLAILDHTDDGLISGAYAQYKLKLLNNKLQFTPGIRSTYFTNTNKWYWEPRMSLHYKINEHFKVNAAWGIYHQFANRVTREDISNGSKDFWILSNDSNIPVSNSTHYITGISWENRYFLFSMEGFYKDYTGLSEYSLRFERSMHNTTYEENFSTGVGYAKGLEFLAQKKHGKLTGWISYTLMEARNQFDIYGKDYFPSLQDVTNEFKIVLMYAYKKWDFSATWIYGTGQPYTAPLGGYQIELLDGSTSDYIIVGDKNSARLPDYHRLDLAVNYNLFIQDKTRNIGSIGLSIFNLYDRQNTWYKEYQIEDGELIEIDQQFMGFTPNISLNLKLW